MPVSPKLLLGEGYKQMDRHITYDLISCGLSHGICPAHCISKVTIRLTFRTFCMDAKRRLLHNDDYQPYALAVNFDPSLLSGALTLFCSGGCSRGQTANSSSYWLVSKKKKNCLTTPPLPFSNSILSQCNVM